jgi:uncharacterized membrane protein YfcA
MPSQTHLLVAFIAAFLAGAINSVAGGGSMISFPVLIALGVPPITANATNTVGIWPGALGSIWGFRPELRRIPKVYLLLLIPALMGAALGAFLLRLTSASLFERVVPWLLLFATLLFIVQAPIRERLARFGGTNEQNGEHNEGRNESRSGGRNGIRITLVIALQIGVSVYGGYFGAGMSILMLSILGIMGMTDMLEMTAMTSMLSLAINGVAGVIFIFCGLISWPYALVMAGGAILGGYGAVGVARKVGKNWIKRFVILVGLTLAVAMFYKIY